MSAFVNGKPVRVLWLLNVGEHELVSLRVALRQIRTDATGRAGDEDFAFHGNGNPC